MVTFRDIDELHQRPEGTTSRNFLQNKSHFIESEDYFLIKPADLQNNEFRGFEDVPNRGLILLTESGYLMLTKSLTDDLAWQVQRQLVNAYFRRKKAVQSTQEWQNIRERVEARAGIYELTGFSRDKAVRYALVDEQNEMSVDLSHYLTAQDEYEQEKYQALVESDSATAFIHEKCHIHHLVYVGRSALYVAYAQWCKEQGLPVMSRVQFNKRLRLHVPSLRDGKRSITSDMTKRVKVWMGITLQQENR